MPLMVGGTWSIQRELMQANQKGPLDLLAVRQQLHHHSEFHFVETT